MGRCGPLLCILLTLLPWGAPKAIDVGAHAGLFRPLNEDTGIPEYGGAHGLSLGLDLEKELPRIGAVVAGASWIPLEVDATDFFPRNRGYEGWGACGRVGVVPGPDAETRFIGGAFLHRRHIEWEDADPEEEGFVQSTRDPGPIRSLAGYGRRYRGAVGRRGLAVAGLRRFRPGRRLGRDMAERAASTALAGPSVDYPLSHNTP